MKRVIIILILLLVFNSLPINLVISANNVELLDVNVYKIYDENFNYLFEKDGVSLGDNYLSSDFKYYEITYVDHDNKKGIAKFIKYMNRPRIKNLRNNINNYSVIDDKTICMYMTHNDESYVPSDGVESIYGNGGIKDVASAFALQLEKRGVDVLLDDTLHIPHDTSAYSRSEKTARKLQDNYNPDAMFDIHRDGTSRRFYVTSVDGIERGRVRIVIGKANPNMALNEEFALYLMAVGKELYPWLFTDIYYASGHYNQGIDSKAILFEMGSHLCEKELIVDSMPELAEVVTTALYQTTVNQDSGDMIINGDITEENLVVNELLDTKETPKTSIIALTIIVILLAGIFVYAFVVLAINAKKLANNFRKK